jgi:hypothetical protein
MKLEYGTFRFLGRKCRYILSRIVNPIFLALRAHFAAKIRICGQNIDGCKSLIETLLQVHEKALDESKG